MQWNEVAMQNVQDLDIMVLYFHLTKRRVEIYFVTRFVLSTGRDD